MLRCLLLLTCLLPLVKSLLFSCVGQMSVPCGSPQIPQLSSRIVGGQQSTLGAMPWMVVIADRGFFLCGGSIISARLILTAAHCFDTEESQNPRNLQVYAAKLSLAQPSKEEQLLTVQTLILHKNFDNITGANDIALLVMENELVFTSLVAPICLPSSGLSLTTGMAAIVAGWGLTLGTGTDYVLNQVLVPIVSDNTCSLPDWQGSKFLPEVTFCAGYEEGGRDACLGDSGSPLIRNSNNKWFAVGIVSNGDDCALPRKPGIYTNVSYYIKWIEDTLLLNNLPFPCNLR